MSSRHKKRAKYPILLSLILFSKFISSKCQNSYVALKILSLINNEITCSTVYTRNKIVATDIFLCGDNNRITSTQRRAIRLHYVLIYREKSVSIGDKITWKAKNTNALPILATACIITITANLRNLVLITQLHCRNNNSNVVALRTYTVDVLLG